MLYVFMYVLNPGEMARHDHPYGAPILDLFGVDVEEMALDTIEANLAEEARRNAEFVRNVKRLTFTAPGGIWSACGADGASDFELVAGAYPVLRFEVAQVKLPGKVAAAASSLVRDAVISKVCAQIGDHGGNVALWIEDAAERAARLKARRASLDGSPLPGDDSQATPVPPGSGE